MSEDKKYETNDDRIIQILLLCSVILELQVKIRLEVKNLS